MPACRLWGSVADMVPGFSHGSNAIQAPIVRERAVWRLYSIGSIVECGEEHGDWLNSRHREVALASDNCCMSPLIRLSAGSGLTQ